MTEVGREGGNGRREGGREGGREVHVVRKRGREVEREGGREEMKRE